MLFSSKKTNDKKKQVNIDLELMSKMNQEFALSLDLSETLNTALKVIISRLNAQAANIFLIDEKNKIFKCIAANGQKNLIDLEVPSHQGVMGKALQKGSCLRVGDVRKDVREIKEFYFELDEKTNFVTKSVLCSPLLVANEKIGVIQCHNKNSESGLFEEMDRKLLDTLCGPAALAIRNAKMASELVGKKIIQKEIELVGEIQKNLLSKNRDESFPIAGINIPAKIVSGDFYNFSDLGNGRYGFAIADVSGKGIKSSILMSKASSLYRCLSKTMFSTKELLKLLNKEICETISKGMFVTMIIGIYDSTKKEIMISNAGHETPLFFSGKDSFKSFETSDPPLGIQTTIEYKETTIPFSSGSLYIFTDGITEIKDSSDLMLGAEGLKTYLLKHQKNPNNSRLKIIIENIISSGKIQKDDLTLLVIDAK